jgi:hypothetical protein
LPPHSTSQPDDLGKLRILPTMDLAGNSLDQNPTLAGNKMKVWSFTIKRLNTPTA